MKYRNGFVSNSSSSSFVLKLDKPIEEYSFDEFVEYFGGRDPLKQIYTALKEDSNVYENNEYHVYLGSECNSTEAEDWLYDNGDSLEERGILLSCESCH